MALAPTLWRTCRVLANPLRLRCLQVVLRQPGPSVSGPVASQYLRDLQARGMIAVTRRSRWVCYDGRPDPSVAHAAALLAAMRMVLEGPSFSPRHTQRLLKGFTHPRRLAILRVLDRSSPLRFAALARATGISEPALARHLRKLETCGLVMRLDEAWAMAGGLPPLALHLLRENRG